jgi:hypothetical protein
MPHSELLPPRDKVWEVCLTVTTQEGCCCKHPTMHSERLFCQACQWSEVEMPTRLCQLEWRLRCPLRSSGNGSRCQKCPESSIQSSPHPVLCEFFLTVHNILSAGNSGFCFRVLQAYLKVSIV